MADETNLNVDTPIGDLSNLADAPDDALLVVEYLGKAYNSTLGQLKAALGAITSFKRTSGDGTPGSTDVYTVTFANGGKLEMPIPIAKNGTDAVSPTAKVTATDTGWHIVITDKDGEHPFDITNGKNGANGVSPTAKVTATDTGWHVVITDKDGEHPFDITNGKNGADGVSPTAKVTATDTGWHVVITDKNGEHPFDLLHGLNGADGVSPDVSVQQVSGGYRVTITDKDGAHYFTLKHGESSSSDWAQKYPDGAGYVENRIAYKDVYGVDGEVITENVNFITSVANTTGLMKDALEPGGKYVVRWNNQPYHCICKESLTDGPYIGNGALFGGAEDLENTGEPFCIYRFTEDYYQIIKDTDTEETIFVEVYGFAVIDLKQMDGELLPEGYPYRETVKIAIMAEQIAMLPAETDFGKSTEIVELTVGGQYIVNWDGKEYACVGKEYVTDELTSVCIGDVSSLTGGESTGEPFAVVMVPGDRARIYRHKGTTFTTISVTEIKEVVHPMDKEFIPDGVGVTDYNKLDNKPVGVDVVEILPETTVEIDPETSDGIITDTSVTAVTEGMICTVNWNGTNYDCTAQIYAEDGVTVGHVLGNLDAMTGGAGTGEPFIILCALPETVELMGASGQLYALDGSASATLSITGKTVKKLDEQFFPDGYPYKETVTVSVLEETTVEGLGEGEMPIASTFELTAGKKYLVRWNGTDYPCTAQAFDMGGVICGCVGDLGAASGEGVSTGEPFAIIAVPGDMVADVGAGGMVMSLDGSTSATFSITGEEVVVHKIAYEYLPDGVPGVETFGDEVLPEITVTLIEGGGYTDKPIGKVVVGRKYNIILDGVTYPATVEEPRLITNGVCAIVADDDSSIYVDIADAETTMETGLTAFIHAPAGEHTLSIDGGYVVHQMDERCLPVYRQALVIPFVYKERVDTSYAGQFVIKWFYTYTTSVTHEDAVNALERKKVLLAEIYGMDGSVSTGVFHYSHFEYYNGIISAIVFNRVEGNIIQELRWNVKSGIAELKERTLVEEKWVRASDETFLGRAAVHEYLVIHQGEKYYRFFVNADGVVSAKDITVTEETEATT